MDEIADKVGLNRRRVMPCVSKYREGGVENALFDAVGCGRNAEITDDDHGPLSLREPPLAGMCVGRDQTSDLSPCLVSNAGLTEVW